jgi:hypothetical protein
MAARAYVPFIRCGNRIVGVSRSGGLACQDIVAA